MAADPNRPSDQQLRLNHDFVHRFEAIRKQFGYRDMDDAALHQVAGFLDCDFRDLRMARNLRNAIAHAEPANPERIEHCLRILRQDAPTQPVGEPARQVQPARRKAYRIHAWQDPDLGRQMLANGFVSVGGDEIGDLSPIADAEEIRRRIEISMPDRTAAAIGIFVGYWRRFLWEASLGDAVVIPIGSQAVAIGEFTGPYRYAPQVEPHARHRRAVDWHAEYVERSLLAEDLLKVVGGRHTIQEFKAPDAGERLLAIADAPRG